MSARSNDCASMPTSRWCTTASRLRCRYSIGSSIVRMWHGRIALIASMSVAMRRGLTGTGRTGEQDQAALEVDELAHRVGQADVVEVGDVALDQPERDRGQAPLEERVATEAVACPTRTRSRCRGSFQRSSSCSSLSRSRRNSAMVGLSTDGRPGAGRIAPSTRTSGAEPIDRARSVPLASTTACRAAASDACISTARIVIGRKA